MVKLQALQRGRAAVALEYVERARARSLLDSLAADSRANGNQSGGARSLGQPLLAEEIVRALPRGVILIEYFLLDDRLVTWIISADGIRMSEHPLDVGWLEVKVYSLRAEIELRSTVDVQSGASTELYQILLGEVELPPGETVVIIPDGVLHLVPFSALQDPATGRYLVEERPVAVAPSATVALGRAGRGTRAMASPGKVLAVGNPAISRDEFPTRSVLTEAEREAVEIAALYPAGEALTGDGATKRKIEAALPRAEVFHFSGHALVNEETPWRSRLLVARSAGDSGDLFLSDIARLPLAQLRLVVLGACSTGIGRIWSNEGVVGLVRPFLAAGVPTVVASLWDVDDTSSAELLVALHERIRLGDSPANALRAAQLQLLRSQSPLLRAPASWASFQVYAGSL
jgi:CHAT domain-containing protein